jgi:DNA replication protein DnaC
MPMTMPEIEQTLRRLRLSGICATLETRALQAAQGEMSFLDAFSALLQDETDRRRSRSIERSFLTSGLGEKKILSEFDWHYNPKIPKKGCIELSTLNFITQGNDALLLGTSGTGKSHVAMSIAHAAILAGFRVVYREAHALFPEIHQATQLGNRAKLLRTLSEADLVVLDDLFLRKLPADAGDELQEIILNRYKLRKSTLITSNRILSDWGKLLGDNIAATTIMDRLLHRGALLQFEGKSYRLKEAAARLAIGKTAE